MIACTSSCDTYTASPIEADHNAHHQVHRPDEHAEYVKHERDPIVAADMRAQHCAVLSVVADAHAALIAVLLSLGSENATLPTVSVSGGVVLLGYDAGVHAAGHQVETVNQQDRSGLNQKEAYKLMSLGIQSVECHESEGVEHRQQNHSELD